MTCWKSMQGWRMQTDTTTRMVLAVKRAALRAYVKAGQIKTEGSYRRQVWNIIRDLYNGEIDEYQFVDDFNVFIDNQFGRAWREGARDMGVNPNQFTDEDYNELARRIEEEQGHMLQLADDLLSARASQSGLEPFRGRADMYANRYNDILNAAHVWFGGKRMLEWQYGDTDHCNDCSRLNGIVASADDWKESGWQPQSRDLECGGYHCQCRLVPTDKPPTPGGIP